MSACGGLEVHSLSSPVLPLLVTCRLEMRRQHPEHVPVGRIEGFRGAHLVDGDITGRAWMRALARIDADDGRLLWDISDVQKDARERQQNSATDRDLHTGMARANISAES